MAVIQNIFKNLEFKLGMTEEIKLFKWSQKPILEKIAQLMEWNETFGPEAVLVQAAEQILELNYPTEYLKYSAAQQKFKHTHPFFNENTIEDVGGFIEWINGVFDKFEGLQEGLLGGLVVSPAFEGSIVSCEYEKGKLMRVLNKGDGDDAEMIVNLMDLGSIPNEISVKKNAAVRGVITLKDPTKRTKGTTITAAVNQIMFNDKAEDTNLVFVPHEWLSSEGGWVNSSKAYQIMKDNGFQVPAFYLAGQVIEALEKYQEYMGTDFGFEKNGCRIEVEKADTINKLLAFMTEDQAAYFYHKVILLG
jgi:NAD-dependent DNA ligase